MQLTSELFDALYREEILEARQMPAELKLRLGGDLFDELCERMCAGIHCQFPNESIARVEAILSERLEIARRLEGV
jgi:hypothetical protein